MQNYTFPVILPNSLLLFSRPFKKKSYFGAIGAKRDKASRNCGITMEKNFHRLQKSVAWLNSKRRERKDDYKYQEIFLHFYFIHRRGAKAQSSKKHIITVCPARARRASQNATRGFSLDEVRKEAFPLQIYGFMAMKVRSVEKGRSYWCCSCKIRWF